jgi:uncharacterized protein YjdB
MEKILRYNLVILVILIVNTSLLAGPVRLRLPDTTAMEKDTISYPVMVDSTLTGENVLSFQLQITYSESLLEVIDIVGAGSLTEGWSNVEYTQPQEGILRIAAAGAEALSGKGTLLWIRLYAKSNGNSAMRFDPDESNLLNEGSPSLILDDGSISVSALPVITVSPDTDVLLTGATRQFSVSGGTAPYTWGVTVDSVASISSSGLLTAEKRGFTKIFVQDSEGLRDTTNNRVEVRAVKLSFRDTSGWQGNTVTIPLYTTDLSTLSIVSGTVTLSYNHSILQARAFSKAGSLMEGYENIELSVHSAGSCTFSFAGTTPLTGEGVLLYLEFAIDSLSTGSTNLAIENAGFNEDILAISETGRFDILPLPDLEINPQTAGLLVGETQQFSVSNGTGPYTWESTRPSVASVDGNGLVTAVAGGHTQVKATDVHGATGSSGNITVYSKEINLPDTTISLSQEAVIPLYITDHLPDEALSAFEMQIGYDTTFLDVQDVSGTGTLSEGWMTAYSDKDGVITIASAGSSIIDQSGKLALLHLTFKPTVEADQLLNLEILQIRLNEGFPFAQTTNGSITTRTVEGKDVGVRSVDAPSSSCQLSSQEQVTITVINQGSETIAAGTGLPVAYQVNALPVVEETHTIPNDFAPGNTLSVTFTQTADMSQEGDYQVQSWTQLDNDVYPSNDTAVTTITVHGTPVVDLGPDTLVTQLPVLLDAGPGFASYQWQDGSTQQTFHAEAYGWYKVTVTNEQGCNGSDSIYLSPEMNLGVTRISEPSSACELSANEQVSVYVKNFGTMMVEEGFRFTIVLHINEENPIVETHQVISELASGDSLVHRFAPELDFSATGDYTLTAYTDLNVDVETANDTTQTTITVYGYPDVDLGADTTETSSFPVNLDAGSGFANYEWQDGSSGQTYSAQEEGLYWVIVTDEYGCTASDSIYIREIVGIWDKPDHQEFYIYPNPNQGKARLVFDGASPATGHIEVINILGEVVYRRAILPGQKPVMELNLPELESGIYFVRLIQEELTGTVKMILQ